MCEAGCRDGGKDVMFVCMSRIVGLGSAGDDNACRAAWTWKWYAAVGTSDRGKGDRRVKRSEGTGAYAGW